MGLIRLFRLRMRRRDWRKQRREEEARELLEVLVYVVAALLIYTVTRDLLQ